MAQGRSLWEMLKDSVRGPRELKGFNPLKAQVGRSVAIEDVDWRDHSFTIREFREYRRQIEGREFVFADYGLYERALSGAETKMRLWLNPAEDAQDTGQDFRALLLAQEDDMAYNEGLHLVLKDPSGVFRIEQDGKVTAEFQRLHGLIKPYQAEVTVMVDENRDKRIDKDEVSTVKLDYWDFSREVPDAAGQMETEYLFVEMDKSSGWMQIWRGKEFNPRKIMVI
jgi:hypothetical protein